MNAIVRRVDHDGAVEKQVKYADLLPVGTLFPEMMLPVSVPVILGQFYFFEKPYEAPSAPSDIVAGKLTHYESSTEICTLHTYVNRTKNPLHYQPAWLSSKGTLEYGRNSIESQI